ncbi:hypothetical protein [Cohnella thailandensis]|uniref:Uncharacterized protein n=1 Tax=Cohnella thailandensis TaxID=557557 RepID=A0A841T411_9BACL|nr:hypothetical protein [Cohnella thailandensis]MBB6637739.1 hypothetical protein [Cohnella thailandensis]MBP1974084.1 hypothetical protein [Cohnella thailandensis]
MLSFEEKLAIADSFAELARKDVSMGRVNYHYEGSAFEKKTVVYHLHRNGNGFVYVGRLREFDGKADDKGMVSIRDYGAEEFRELVAKSIASLSLGGEAAASTAKPSKEERWINDKKQTLELKLEDEEEGLGGMWYVYAGLNLDGVFDSYREAVEYLEEEGFTRA